MSRRFLTSIRRTAAVLATGAAIAAALWVVDLAHLAWLGFFGAGIWWALPTSMPDRPPKEPVTAHRLPVSFGAVPPGTYEVVAAQTRLEVRARKLRHWTVRAVMHPVTGSIQWRGAAQTANVEGSVPAAGFRSGTGRRDLHVIGPQFLDAQGHPHLRYTSQAFTAVSPGSAESAGELTVRGVTRPVTWLVSGLASGPDTSTFRVRARTRISRSAFGMSGFGWLVGDGVDIEIDLTARRRGAGARA